MNYPIQCLEQTILDKIWVTWGSMLSNVAAAVDMAFFLFHVLLLWLCWCLKKWDWQDVSSS